MIYRFPWVPNFVHEWPDSSMPFTIYAVENETRLQISCVTRCRHPWHVIRYDFISCMPISCWRILLRRSRKTRQLVVYAHLSPVCHLRAFFCHKIIACELPGQFATLSPHYGDVTMGAIGPQITSLTVVYSTVYSDVDQRKHQSSASLAFVRGIHRGPVNSPHKWPVTRKMFPFDDVIMSKHVQCDIRILKLWICRVDIDHRRILSVRSSYRDPFLSTNFTQWYKAWSSKHQYNFLGDVFVHQ